MSKLSRSMLWTGLLAAGVAACGDDVTVTPPPPPPSPTVHSISVTPDGQTVPIGVNVVTMVAAVNADAGVATTVTWSSGDASKATVAADGKVTTLAVGPVSIKACSTVVPSVCGAATLNITNVAPTPASASIKSVNWVAPTGPTVCTQGGGPSVPVALSSVRCQIEVTANVNGGDQALSRLDVVMTNTALGTSVVVASQTFPGTAPVDGGDQALSAPIEITMSINTQMLRRPGAAGTPFIPAIFNGNNTLSLALYVVGNLSPAIFDPRPLVMNNTDALIAPTGLAATSTTPSFTDANGVTWFTGSLTFTGAQYISFSTVTPTSIQFTASVCGTSTTTGSVSGTAATGISVSSTFDCTGFEGLASITAPFPTIVMPTLSGPDGTAVTVPTDYSGVGSAFCLPIAGNPVFSGTPPACTPNADARWNLITPATPSPTLPGPVAIDNLGPLVTIGIIAFNAGYDQFWVNADYDLSAQVTAVDGGSGALGGNVVSTRFWNFGPPASCSGAALTSATAASLAETLTSNGFDSYTICGVATDPLGNVGTSGASNPFGVDKTAPLARLAGSTLAAPSIGPSSPSTVSVTPNTTIFATAASVGTQVWGLEGFDNRSGFNQNVVAGDDAAHQDLTQTLYTGITACPGMSDQLTIVLSDSWVRTPVLTPIDCSSGTGYYDYAGWAIDRAGNTSQSTTPLIYNFAEDLVAPATLFMSPNQSVYVGGQAAAFNIFATDDLEVLNAYLAFAFPTLGPPAIGIQYPYGSFPGLVIGLPWPSNPPISALVPSAGVSGIISIPYFLARIDESCTGAGIPYTSCTATFGSKPTVGSDYNTDLNLLTAVTDAGKAPTGALTNVNDIADRDGVTGAAFSFNPAVTVTPLAEQWSGASDVATFIGKNSSGDCPASTMCADQQTATSNGLRFFDTPEHMYLFRLNTTTNQWTFCNDMNSTGATPFIDNGIYRIWRWTSSVPGAGTACNALTGFWRVMGTKNGAGLFSPSF
jgi:hypothetical protein